MTASDLTKVMLAHAIRLHPDFTHDQCLVWALAMLAEVVLEKNEMDSIVFERLSERIDKLYTTHHDHFKVIK